MPNATTITAPELRDRLAVGQVRQFWNVLVPDYFTGEMIPGSRHVPVGQVGRELAALDLPKDTPIVVYCSGPTCPNSRQAGEKLLAFGYVDVRAFEGGLAEWSEAGFPVERAEVGV